MSDIAWVNQTNHPTATGWASRVVTNGGAAPSDYNVARVSDFCGALDAAGITPLMIDVCIFAPDNLIASITPLINLLGNDPWTNHNFIADDLTVSGLRGDGTSKYLDTGVVANVAFSGTGEGGLSLYNTFADQGSGVDFYAGQSPNFLGMLCCSGGQAFFDCWNNTTSRVSGTPLTYGLGFTSGNRISSSDSKLYTASSVSPFAQIGTLGSVAGATMTENLFLFCNNASGTPGSYTVKRFSFAAIHKGLTSTQCQALYNAVQALRQAFGGGWI